MNDTVEKKPGFFKEFIKFAFIALLIVVPIRVFVAQPFIVSGSSMYPTFETGQYLIVDQLNYKLHNPKRGDVIIFRFPNDTKKFFIKRIIGLPGETLEILDGNVYISNDGENKFKLTENYIVLSKSTSMTVKLGDSEYFVMGDNRESSLDSRTWGPLSENYIIGRAYVRLLPVDKIDFHPGSIRDFRI